MPMGPIAPTTRGPFITPLFIGAGARPFRIGDFTAFAIPTHGECMHGVGVCLKLASHVACFGVAQHAASCRDSERKVTNASVEGQLDVQQRGDTVAEAADCVRYLF
eukprot:4115508-Pleurochrysis_carterae.AAC.1